MSSSITQCPGCYTRFRVTTEQLTAHNGIVRCGLCSAIFNAPEHLHDDEPSPQLTLPITHTDVQDQSPAEVVEPEKPIEIKKADGTLDQEATALALIQKIHKGPGIGRI